MSFVVDFHVVAFNKRHRWIPFAGNLLETVTITTP
jgi:hypothetical protein